MLKQFGCVALVLALSACGSPVTVGQTTASVGGVSIPADGQPTPPPVTYVPQTILPEDVNARIQQGENILIVDVRGEPAYKTQHIKGAINVPWGSLEQLQDQLPKDRYILLYCTCPDEHSSAGAATELHESYGFDKLLVLKGGMQDWMAKGYLTEKPAEAPQP